MQIFLFFHPMLTPVLIFPNIDPCFPFPVLACFLLVSSSVNAFFSVWFPKEIRCVWSHCWAFWGHSSHPVHFDPSKEPSYPFYQISLKLLKDTKWLQVLLKTWQWRGDTHSITSTKGKVAAGIQQSPAQLAASTYPGENQAYLTVHSRAGTVRQCCTEEGREEVCSRKQKTMQWEGQGVIPLSLVKEINTNSTGRQTSPKFCCLQVKGDTFCVL